MDGRVFDVDSALPININLINNLINNQNYNSISRISFVYYLRNTGRARKFTGREMYWALGGSLTVPRWLKVMKGQTANTPKGPTQPC